MRRSENCWNGIHVLGLFVLAHLILAPAAQADFTKSISSILGSVNYNSRSASLGDIDDDGDLDLFFQGGGSSQQFFRNNIIGTGSATFTNITGSMVPSGLGPSWSAAWGDYDADGKVDIFVGQSNIGGAGDVLRNTGAELSNTSVATGLDDPGFHQNVAWSDIDNDNDLDLILGMEGPEKHEIYLQENDGTFTPVGAAAGFQEATGTKAYGMAIGDYDGDGDMDIYISTCRSDNNIRNHFYKNMLVETGSLTFDDVADSNGTQFMTNSYGAEFHDFDDDGDLDLFMVGADGEDSKIWRNNGDGNFTDIDTITGHALLSDLAGDLNGGRVIDYDNDGDLDLFFHDHKPFNGRNEARKLYRNDGNWEFTDVTLAEGLEEENRGAYDSTWGDIDLDGDLDLISPTDSSWNERVFVSDESTNGNHWLYFTLDGPAHNTTGIGAALYATIDEGTPQERTIRREANTNAGTFNQSDLPVHFGLGAANEIDTLRIVWDNGVEQFLFGISADQYMNIDFVEQLAGDYNADGIVNAADYTVWLQNLGAPAGSLFNAIDSGVIGQAHYDTWKANFGNTSSASSSSDNTSVPEPTAMILLLCGMGAAASRRRR